jgi:hypothetical protein
LLAELRGTRVNLPHVFRPAVIADASDRCLLARPKL